MIKFSKNSSTFTKPKAIILLILSYAKSVQLNFSVCFPTSRNSNRISSPASGIYAKPNSFRYTRSIVIACIVNNSKSISHAVFALWTCGITRIAMWTRMPLAPDVHRCSDTINLIPSSTKWRESKHPNETCWELKPTFYRFRFEPHYKKTGSDLEFILNFPSHNLSFLLLKHFTSFSSISHFLLLSAAFSYYMFWYRKLVYISCTTTI